MYKEKIAQLLIFSLTSSAFIFGTSALAQTTPNSLCTIKIAEFESYLKDLVESCRATCGDSCGLGWMSGKPGKFYVADYIDQDMVVAVDKYKELFSPEKNDVVLEVLSNFSTGLTVGAVLGKNSRFGDTGIALYKGNTISKKMGWIRKALAIKCK